MFDYRCFFCTALGAKSCDHRRAVCTWLCVKGSNKLTSLTTCMVPEYAHDSLCGDVALMLLSSPYKIMHLCTIIRVCVAFPFCKAVGTWFLWPSAALRGRDVAAVRMSPLVASLLLVVRPGAPSGFLLLVAMPGAPSSVLATSRKIWEDCTPSSLSIWQTERGSRDLRNGGHQCRVATNQSETCRGVRKILLQHDAHVNDATHDAKSVVRHRLLPHQFWSAMKGA